MTLSAVALIYIKEDDAMYVADSKRLTAAGAKRMMATAIERAQKDGIAIVVAIVDNGGHILLLERMDGGRFHSVHSALAKAVCAASNRRSTGPRGAQGQALDVQHALGLALDAGPERFTAMEGGYPIIVGGECIGGIGVAGGTFEFDEEVAKAAIEAIGGKAA
jgi:glc operon protein GlcG